MDEYGEQQGLLDSFAASATTRVSITGMTCQSCVRKIEDNLKTKLGVFRIKVVLPENAGYIDYDATLTDPKSLVSYVRELGFICHSDDVDQNEDESFKKDVLETIIYVQVRVFSNIN